MYVTEIQTMNYAAAASILGPRRSLIFNFGGGNDGEHVHVLTSNSGRMKKLISCNEPEGKCLTIDRSI